MLKTFKKGGIHPSEYKLSANQPIQRLDPPATVVVQLSQGIGPPSVPVVAKGDEVKTGQLLAEGKSFISSNIHSPVSGKVIKIDGYPDVSGYKRPAITIQVNGDEWVETIDRSDNLISEIELDAPAIIQKIKEMGIVGMGGASFPTHVKFMVPDGKKADALIINGVECEPYLTSDHRVMLERGEELLVGIQILMKALQVDKAYIGIENNKPDAIEHLTKLSSDIPGITIVPLKVQYPQGGEKQLIDAILRREVPSGKLPIDVGCVVQNVGTALAVYEAVQKNKPLIERVVTVTGKEIPNPGNYLVRIGTPVAALIEAVGGLPEYTGKIINGGPMMGKALNSTDIPVVKGMSGLLVFSQPDARRVPERPCIRCARCTQVCPMGLEPYLLAQYSEINQDELAEDDHIMDCIECGSCAYTCPAGRPLLDNIRKAKTKVGQIIRTRSK
jgi:Na+-translocating ferredoxin:NAD+ oxidoreductase subunit C